MYLPGRRKQRLGTSPGGTALRCSAFKGAVTKSMARRNFSGNWKGLRSPGWSAREIFFLRTKDSMSQMDSFMAQFHGNLICGGKATVGGGKATVTFPPQSEAEKPQCGKATLSLPSHSDIQATRCDIPATVTSKPQDVTFPPHAFNMPCF